MATATLGQIERAERSAVMKKSSVKLSPSEGEALRLKLFGLVKAPKKSKKSKKSKKQLIVENKDKYSFMADKICSLLLANGDKYHGRLSKQFILDPKDVGSTTKVTFNSFGTQEYVTIDLASVVKITTKGLTQTY